MADYNTERVTKAQVGRLQDRKTNEGPGWPITIQKENRRPRMADYNTETVTTALVGRLQYRKSNKALVG